MFIAKSCRAYSQLLAYQLRLETLIAKTWLPVSNHHHLCLTQRHVHNQNFQPYRIASAQSGPRTRSRGIKNEKQLRDHTLLLEKGVELRTALQKAVTDNDIDALTELYHALVKNDRLTISELKLVTQCIRQCLNLKIWKYAAPKRQVEAASLVSFAEQLVNDIEKRRLPPSAIANATLLSLFKDAHAVDVGIRFWRWLESQEDFYTGHSAYAAAIELLTVSGWPLADLEELYQKALARFPGSFFAYHLSPNAIALDRDQPCAFTVPKPLIQAITIARLLLGDSRNAYLALDTAFRLDPGIVSGPTIWAFLEERPIAEGFTVLAVSCYTGNPISIRKFSEFLRRLRQSLDASPAPVYMCSLRAMVAAIYLQLGAGGKINDQAVTEVVIAIPRLLRLPGVEKFNVAQREKIVDLVMSLVRKALEIFASEGVKPKASAFSSIIVNVGGYGKAKDIIGTALADMQALELQPTDVTHRAIVTACGLLQDESLVAEAWAALLNAKTMLSRYPNEHDFSVLIRSARVANCPNFAKQQLEEFKESLSSEYHERAYEILDQQFVPSEEHDVEIIDFESLEVLIRKLDFDLDALKEKTRNRSAIRDFSSQSLPMKFFPMPDELTMPEHETRKVYDELTAEQKPGPAAMHQLLTTEDTNQNQNEARAPAMTHSNLTYGQVRYEAWKSINYLLHLAEKYDQEYHQAVDEAIAARLPPPPQNTKIHRVKQQAMNNLWLSDMGELDPEAQSSTASTPAQIKRAREKILRLRGRLASN